MFAVSTSYRHVNFSSSQSGRYNSFGESPTNLKPGDTIDIQRKGYRHFAIYVGKGKVIHRTVEGKIGIVEEDDVWNVLQDDKWKRNTYDDKLTPFSSNLKIVKRAKAQLGPSEYHPLTKNCEHLANWCRYNVETSKQVTDYCFWTCFEGSKQRKNYTNNFYSHSDFCDDDKLELDELLYHFRFYDHKRQDERLQLLGTILKVSTRLKNSLHSNLPDVGPNDKVNVRALTRALLNDITCHVTVLRQMKRVMETRLMKPDTIELIEEIMDASLKITETYGADQTMINEAKRLKDHPEDHEVILKNMLKWSEQTTVSAEVNELISKVQNASNSIASRGQFSRIRHLILGGISRIPFLPSFKDEDLACIQDGAALFLSAADQAFNNLKTLAWKLQEIGGEDIDAYRAKLLKLEHISLLEMSYRKCLQSVEDIQEVSRKMLNALEYDIEHKRGYFMTAVKVTEAASRSLWDILRSFLQ